MQKVISPQTGHAFFAAGAFFVGMGVLLLDGVLVAAGNIVLTMGILMGIRSTTDIPSLLLFFSGMLLSFRAPRLGVFLEIISLGMWSKQVLIRYLTPNRLLRVIYGGWSTPLSIGSRWSRSQQE